MKCGTVQSTRSANLLISEKPFNTFLAALKTSRQLWCAAVIFIASCDMIEPLLSSNVIFPSAACLIVPLSLRAGNKFYFFLKTSHRVAFNSICDKRLKGREKQNQIVLLVFHYKHIKRPDTTRSLSQSPGSHIK